MGKFFKKKKMSLTKIFTVSFEFCLTHKPEWLDDFRRKFDKPYDFHITLKSPSTFLENNLQEMQEALASLAARHKKFEIIFDKLFESQTSKGGYLMNEARRNDALFSFQKETREAFARFGEPISAELACFEENFRPHITIARELDLKTMVEAKKALGKDILCEAQIDEVILTIAKEDSFAEWISPENKTRASLA